MYYSFLRFYSKALNIKKRKLDELNTQTEEANKKLKTRKEKIAKEKVNIFLILFYLFSTEIRD